MISPHDGRRARRRGRAAPERADHRHLPSYRRPYRHQRGWTLVAWAVLVLGLTGSAAGASLYRASIEHQAQRSIDATGASVGASLASQLHRDGDLTAAVRAMYETTPQLNNVLFAAWWSALGAADRYPESTGFGIVLPVLPSELPAYGAAATADTVDAPGLAIPPFVLAPPGVRALYCLGRFGVAAAGLGPTFAAGFDLCAVPDYASALWLAADTGQAVVLRISASTFGMIIPIYRDRVMPPAVADRRPQLVAWTGGIFRPGPLLSAASGGQSGLTVTLYRQNPSGPAVLIASSGQSHTGRHRLTDSETVQADGQWLIRVTAPASYGSLSPNVQGLTVLVGGAVLTLLLFLLVIVLLGSRSRALSLVDEKTRELQHQAMHDPLTGLPNRALILDRLEQALARSRRQHTAVSAMFIDLDNFKDINDDFGHAAGDELLRDLAARLATVLRDSDTVGRLGGDEFIVLAEGASLAAGADVMAERLLDVIREPFVVGVNERVRYAVSGSVGVANGDRASAADLLRDADIALYEAKALGKNRYVVFQPAMQTAVHNRLEMEADLRRALDERQFFLVYQPTFDRCRSTVTGVEALPRWRHPSRGVLEPATFVPLAQVTGLIVEIDRWVLQEATRQTRAWNSTGLHLNVSVRVSARQIESDDLVSEVGEALLNSGLDPALLTLEVTETTIMRDAVASADHLGALKTLGIRFAIDDFGTGYSSLAHLRRFPADILKINRGLISSITSSSEAAALISALVQLGQILGMDVSEDEGDRPGRPSAVVGEDLKTSLAFEPLEADAVPSFVAAWSAGRSASHPADAVRGQ